jgi:uncharacterized membrane protein
MVLAYDFLDSMAWDVAISGILLAVGAIAVRYKGSSESNEQKGKSLQNGFAVALAGCGFYLLVTGIGISFTWPFEIASGVYNVLFGGIATLGGLVLLTGSIVILLKADLRPVTYLAAGAGAYSVIDAYAIVHYGLTSSPFLAALGYLSFAAPAFLSVPAAHSDNKLWKWLFVLFALLFAAAWFYQAADFTFAHLQPS